MDTKSIKSDQINPINSLALNKTEIANIKKNLATMIEAMIQETSDFSRAAQYWGRLSHWLKAIISLLITVPPLVAGIMLNWVTLIVASSILIATYGFVVYLLTNHYHHSQVRSKNIKEGIFGLVDILDTVIESLDALAGLLKHAIDDMTEENQKLHEQVEVFKTNLTDLKDQVKRLEKTESDLNDTNESLKQATDSLNTSLMAQTELLELTRAELEKAKSDFKDSEKTLIDKTGEFTRIEQQMKLDIVKQQNVAKVLESTVSELSGTVISDQKEREEFQGRLNEFLQDKNASFDKMADRICEAEKKFAILQEQYNKLNHEHSDLIKQQAKHVTSLEKTAQAHQMLLTKAGVNPFTFHNQEKQPNQRAEGAPTPMSAAARI